MVKRVRSAMDNEHEEPPQRSKLRRSRRVANKQAKSGHANHPRPSINLVTCHNENSPGEEVEPGNSESRQEISNPPNCVETDAAAEADASVPPDINDCGPIQQEDDEGQDDLLVPTKTTRLEALINSASTLAVCKNYTKEMMLIGPSSCWPKGFNFVELPESGGRVIGNTAFRTPDDIMMMLYEKSRIKRRATLINYISMKPKKRGPRFKIIKTEKLLAASGIPLDEILRAQVGEEISTPERLVTKTSCVQESKARVRVHLGTLSFVPSKFQTNILMVPIDRVRKAVEPVPEVVKDEITYSVEDGAAIPVKTETDVLNFVTPPPSLPDTSAKQRVRTEVVVKLKTSPSSVSDPPGKSKPKAPQRKTPPSLPAVCIKKNVRKNTKVQPSRKSPVKAPTERVNGPLSVKPKANVLNHSQPRAIPVKPAKQPVQVKKTATLASPSPQTVKPKPVLNGTTPLSIVGKSANEPAKREPRRHMLPLPTISYKRPRYEPFYPTATCTAPDEHPVMSIPNITLKTEKVLKEPVADVLTSTTSTSPAATRDVLSEAIEVPVQENQVLAADVSTTTSARINRLIQVSPDEDRDDQDIIEISVDDNEFDT